VGKEVRVVVRDVSQWSQVFLMGALLFIYLYNIRMLPLAGDTRATVVAYANLMMAGFVVSAVGLRFAYPSVSAEGKAFWLLQTAPISYRRFLLSKLLVYGTPLTLLSLSLTIVANAMLSASALIWGVTLAASVIIAITLVALGIGMGALAPNFDAENPLQVGLSLGGFAYMAISLGYVGIVMFLMARPIVRYLFWRVMGIQDQSGWLSIFVPLVTGLTLSAALIVFPLVLAERRLRGAGARS
jgi:ABC-2 type transport system permease protein